MSGRFEQPEERRSEDLDLVKPETVAEFSDLVNSLALIPETSEKGDEWYGEFTTEDGRKIVLGELLGGGKWVKISSLGSSDDSETIYFDLSSDGDFFKQIGLLGPSGKPAETEIRGLIELLKTLKKDK